MPTTITSPSNTRVSEMATELWNLMNDHYGSDAYQKLYAAHGDSAQYWFRDRTQHVPCEGTVEKFLGVGQETVGVSDQALRNNASRLSEHQEALYDPDLLMAISKASEKNPQVPVEMLLDIADQISVTWPRESEARMNFFDEMDGLLWGAELVDFWGELQDIILEFADRSSKALQAELRSLNPKIKGLANVVKRLGYEYSSDVTTMEKLYDVMKWYEEESERVEYIRSNYNNTLWSECVAKMERLRRVLDFVACAYGVDIREFTRLNPESDLSIFDKTDTDWVEYGEAVIQARASATSETDDVREIREMCAGCTQKVACAADSIHSQVIHLSAPGANTSGFSKIPFDMMHGGLTGDELKAVYGTLSAWCDESYPPRDKE